VSGPQARRPRDDGLQPERTALSWSRTSFGVLGNGALVLVRDLGDDPGPPHLVAAGLAAVIAVTTYLLGRLRQRALAQRPLPTPLAPRREIRLIGASVVILIVVTTLTLPQ
jgi:Domain of unknown function (DUF202)